ncbi:peptidase M48, partial [Pseudomonadota bacterium]
VTRVLDTAKAMIDADGRVDVFEYLLSRVISMHLWESHNPHKVRVAGGRTIKTCRDEVLALLAVLARHGSTSSGEAEAAFAAGLKDIGLDRDTPIPDVREWMAVLDSALPKLDGLKSAEKEKLVRAMTSVVLHDGRLDATEMELLRVSSDLIHVPLPLLTVPRQTSPQS